MLYVLQSKHVVCSILDHISLPGPNKTMTFSNEFSHELMRLFFSRFPQYNLPTFKIAQSGCLKKVRIGEEISLIRLAED
jgi:hypothetical protein